MAFSLFKCSAVLKPLMIMLKIIALPAFLLLFATPIMAEEHNPDPWEGFNRKMFAFNEGADSYVLRPVAKGYKAVTPKPVRSSIGNIFTNLGEVKTIASDLGQLKFKQAASDTGRFLVNLTVGFFGVFDVASHIGLTKHDEDFGQVLGYWGVGSGPYIMWPFLGPSTVRDSAGLGLEYASRISMINFGRDRGENLAIAGLYGINVRASLLDLEGMIQGDRYVFIRSVYLQRRAYLINDGKTKDDFGDDGWEDFDEDDF